MKFFFGKTKIKFEASASFEDSIQNFKEAYGYIADFSSGLSIEFNESKKKYRIDTLQLIIHDDDEERYYQKNDSTINILGYLCNKYLLWDNASAFHDTTKIYIWFSDDIKYIVPKIYQNKLDLPMTDDGNILWLENTQILSYIFPFDGNYKTDIIKLSAISIERIELPDSLFSIPKDYKLTTIY